MHLNNYVVARVESHSDESNSVRDGAGSKSPSTIQKIVRRKKCYEPLSHSARHEAFTISLVSGSCRVGSGGFSNLTG